MTAAKRPAVPNSPYPHWYTPVEEARADEAIRRFTDAAFGHRETCPICQSKQPCDTLRGMIDAVGQEMQAISGPAFAGYVDAAERKYAPRDWRAP